VREVGRERVVPDTPWFGAAIPIPCPRLEKHYARTHVEPTNAGGAHCEQPVSTIRQGTCGRQSATDIVSQAIGRAPGRNSGFGQVLSGPMQLESRVPVTTEIGTDSRKVLIRRMWIPVRVPDRSGNGDQ
jgi:hypothetical protein